MATAQFTIKHIDGLRESNRRAVVFLRCSVDKRIDAVEVFEGLEPKRERDLRSSFDHWMGGSTAETRFHGWPNEPMYKECFVFKWKQNRQRHRFYGFLCHPMPISDRRFELCVLVSHAVKSEWETDSKEKDLQNSLRNNAPVLRAIREAFPETKRCTGGWVN